MLLPPTVTSLDAAVAAWVKIGATRTVARATVAMRVFMLHLLATDVDPLVSVHQRKAGWPAPAVRQMPPQRARHCDAHHSAKDIFAAALRDDRDPGDGITR